MILERFLFQQSECNLSFEMYIFLFCFQIHKGLLNIEHTQATLYAVMVQLINEYISLCDL